MSGSIWPGFVDAMTALLLVLMFVLTIFMIVQGMLRETITGQESELDQLAAEVTSLSQALGLSQQQTALLEDDLADLQTESDRQASLIANLTGQIDAQSRTIAERDASIASFEEQVATLLGERDAALAEGVQLAAAIEDLEAARAQLITEQDAMQLALAQARDEIDDQAEAARLAAAQAEALEALTADLQAEAAERETSLANALAALSQAQEKDTVTAARLEELEAQAERMIAELDETETARLAEAAAAAALRERLENADAELTAMSLTLEAQRKDAEDTLTLLAAAQAIESELDSRLADVLVRLDAAEDDLSSATASSSELQDFLALSESQRQATEAELTETRAALSAAEARLSALNATSDERDADLVRLTTERDALLADMEALQASVTDNLTLREQLAAAIAAKIAAETDSATQMTERERQEVLLSTARNQLAEEEALTAQAQREAALLNEQVSTLRAELDDLQGLLDSAAARDSAAQVRIESLGSDLNQALARAAAEERKRAELEAAEAERLRLEADRLNAEVTDLADYRSEFFGTLRRVLGDRDGIQVVGDRFVFSSEVLFESASATLSAEGQTQIAQVASILFDVSGQIPGEIDWIIRVDGHTDNVPLSGTGLFADNWELSQGRALSVVKFMTERLGFPPERLAATGFGEFRPVNTADSPTARAQNRRIELKLTER